MGAARDHEKGPGIGVATDLSGGGAIGVFVMDGLLEAGDVGVAGIFSARAPQNWTGAIT